MATQDSDRTERATDPSDHAAAARRLLRGGPERWADALDHIALAGDQIPAAELTESCDRAGSLAFDLHDYDLAIDLLRVADANDPGDDPSTRARRLMLLAAAERSRGAIDDARTDLVTAIQLAEEHDDADLAAQATIAYAMPREWATGDATAKALLDRIDLERLDPDRRAEVTAIRAMVEHRLLNSESDGRQSAWITRPEIGRSLADDAVAATTSSTGPGRALACFAWRATHRGPADLAQRSEMSRIASEVLAAELPPSAVHDATIWRAIDAMEAGDRVRYDRSIAIARSIADREGDPMLEYRSLAVEVGAAHLDSDIERAVELAARAVAVGTEFELPAILPMQFSFATQASYDVLDIPAFTKTFSAARRPTQASPIIRIAEGHVLALSGRRDDAEQNLELALLALEDDEALVYTCTRAAFLSWVLDGASASKIIERLEPWIDRVSIQSGGWWCDGPVAIWLAQLHHSLGDRDRAITALETGEPIAAAINDVRSLKRAAMLRASLEASGAVRNLHGLTQREFRILELMASGATNPQIAEQLAFSLSTIRTDSVSIYRKLGVNRRGDAIARGIQLGIIG